MTGLRLCQELPVTPLPPPRSVSSTRPTPLAGAPAFALLNADRVTSLGAFMAPNFASIQPYCQLQYLQVTIGVEIAKISLFPHSLTKLVVHVHNVGVDWNVFRPLCCLQELKVYNWGSAGGNIFGTQLDDSFATVLPLLRVFSLIPAMTGQLYVALETTAEVVMPHLVELSISHVEIVHLDLHFMSALKSLRLFDCTVSTVSAACSTMVLEDCCMGEGAVLVTTNLRSLTIYWGGLHRLDSSRCLQAFSFLCKNSSIKWIRGKSNARNLGEVI